MYLSNCYKLSTAFHCNTKCLKIKTFLSVSVKFVQKYQADNTSKTALFRNKTNADQSCIARGTMDPEIDSVTWANFGDDMAPLALVANLATRWRH